MDEKLKLLGNSNFWCGPVQGLGQLRRQYLEFFAELLQNNNQLIKVITGQRRCGKSHILRQIISYLVTELQTEAHNILYLNLELKEFQNIKTVEQLQELIEIYLQNIPNKKNKIYLFIDEVQEVQAWEKIINAYNADTKLQIDIFITGSNSNLMASELASYLTGRYISKQVFPFAYSEYLEYSQQQASKESLIKFVTESQMPETYHLAQDFLIRPYLEDLKNSILFKDIVKRHEVRNVDLLEKLFLFLVDNLANPFSINSIVTELATLGYNSNTNTVANYLKYFQECFLLHAVTRYDIKGKKILDGDTKYYLNDMGFRTKLFSNYDFAGGKILENYVHNLLVQKGYKCHIGKLGNKKIDFIAEKEQQKIYIQVCDLLMDAKVRTREFGNLELIHDSWPKLVVSLDDMVFTGHPKGVEHIQAWRLGEYI